MVSFIATSYPILNSINFYSTEGAWDAFGNVRVPGHYERCVKKWEDSGKEYNLNKEKFAWAVILFKKFRKANPEPEL